MKKIIALLVVVLVSVCSNLTVWASTGEMLPTTGFRKDIFAGYTVTVLDKTTPAVTVMGRINDRTVMCFLSAGGNEVGAISYSDYNAVIQKNRIVVNLPGGGTYGIPPVAGKSWEEWFADAFNEHRGLSAGSRAAALTDLSKATCQEVFAGVAITVTNETAQAVRIGAYDWPMTKMYFIGADNSNLGYMSADAYMSMMQSCNAKYGTALNNMPGGSEGWYAQLFNDYRGVKRLTMDEYLSINRIQFSALSEDGIQILEQVYGKSAAGYSNGSQSSASGNSSNSNLPASSGNSSNDSRAEVTTDTSGWPSEVVRLTNEERVREGLDELYEDSQLMELAAIRAKELAQQFSHTRPNGKSASTWVMSETGASTAGENIAMGHASPQRVITGWMNSSGHRANILKGKYNVMGAGCYQDPETKVLYWVQLFASSSTDRSTSGNGAALNGTTYSLNKTELNLTAGEGYQLTVDIPEDARDIEIEWEGSKTGQHILAVDNSGYITTFYREGLTSATATMNVSAKIYDSGRLVKTLRCKVTVTQ